MSNWGYCLEWFCTLSIAFSLVVEKMPSQMCVCHTLPFSLAFFFSRYQGMENQWVSFSSVKWKIVVSSYAQQCSFNLCQTKALWHSFLEKWDGMVLYKICTYIFSEQMLRKGIWKLLLLVTDSEACDSKFAFPTGGLSTNVWTFLHAVCDAVFTVGSKFRADTCLTLSFGLCSSGQKSLGRCLPTASYFPHPFWPPLPTIASQ